LSTRRPAGFRCPRCQPGRCCTGRGSQSPRGSGSGSSCSPPPRRVCRHSNSCGNGGSAAPRPPGPSATSVGVPWCAPTASGGTRRSRGASPPGAARISAFGVAVSSSTRRSGSRPWRYAGLLPDGAVPDQLRNGERGAGAHRRHRWLAERRPPSGDGLPSAHPGEPETGQDGVAAEASCVREPQPVAARDAPEGRTSTSLGLPGRVHSPLHPASNSEGRRSPPARHREPAATHDLEPAVWGGVNRIGINHIWYSSVI